MSVPFGKDQTNLWLMVRPESCYATDELGELWSVEYELMEEGYGQLTELRGINSGHEILRIFADPSEH